MAFSAMQASLDLQYGSSIVFFQWGGSDEGDEVTGSGSAELNDDGMLEHFAFNRTHSLRL
ncbi:hypothetical protein FBZ88_106145 [Nitrospirillum bahiense]|uniref:Uncharacterized protein n=1 Tax=Nitrospirillum amazonense TaxID=28077 RepID=A0A560G1G3_9PROT|nr:hypothetical protein FBZ88_106145 [Nitrospirillum amazonense]